MQIFKMFEKIKKSATFSKSLCLCFFRSQIIPPVTAANHSASPCFHNPFHINHPTSRLPTNPKSALRRTKLSDTISVPIHSTVSDNFHGFQTKQTPELNCSNIVRKVLGVNETIRKLSGAPVADSPAYACPPKQISRAQKTTHNCNKQYKAHTH